MYGRSATIFYTLSAFVLLAAAFVLHPSQITEVAALQDKMLEQFSVAWQQTIGDQPYFDDLALVYVGVNEFYSQAAESSMAYLGHGAGDEDLVAIFAETYHELGLVFNNLTHPSANQVVAAHNDPNFMSEPAIYNIIPIASMPAAVAGALVEEVVNEQMPWVTMRDSFTGQLYCVAIYNNEFNKYLGQCKYDYH